MAFIGLCSDYGIVCVCGILSRRGIEKSKKRLKLAYRETAVISYVKTEKVYHIING